MPLLCASASAAEAHGPRAQKAVGSLLLAVGAVACAPATEQLPDSASASGPRFPALVDMVLVPGPRDATAGSDEDLLIDRFEVTDGEFAVFLEATHYVPADANEFLRHWRQVDGRREPPEADSPVRHISLADADAYARWRGKSLPTRDEWLRACPSLRDGDLPWRPRAFTGACNSAYSELGAPMPVGSYELGRTSRGCYDVIGNVAEWTTTAAFGPELCFVLGGSFWKHCQDGAPANVGAPLATGSRHDLDEELLEPWQERVAPESRRDDIGMRCVIRDVAATLDAAFAEVEALTGSARAAAIAELLAVGAWPYGDNQILPYVRARAFARRIRCEQQLASSDVTSFRGEIERSADGRDLIVSEPGRVRRLAGSDGRELRRFDLPFAGAMTRAPWLTTASGRAAACVYGPRGEIALVDLEDGHCEQAPAAGQEQSPPTFAVSDAGADGAVWFVQKLQQWPAESDPAVPLETVSLTRIVRFGREGVRERTLPGELYVTPPPAGGDGLLVLILEALPIDLPAGWASPKGYVSVPFAWVNAQLLGPDLVTRSHWLISDDEQRVGDRTQLRWRFAPEGGALPRVDVLTVANSAQRYLRPLTRANSYLLDDGGGQPWLLRSEAGSVLPPVPLAVDGRATLIPPSPSGCSEPFLLSLDGERLLGLGEGVATYAVADRLGLGGQPTLAARSPDGDTLVLRTRQGRWVGVSIAGRRANFAFELAGEASIAERLFGSGNHGVVLSQPTTHSAWIRRLGDGSVVDTVGVVRPPLGRILMVDANGDGGGEIWTLLGDGRLVALREPEAASAKLAADCESTWRRRQSWHEGER